MGTRVFGGFAAVSGRGITVDDDLYLAIRPMPAVSGGALWLMSAPFGKRGFFHEEWAHGGESWERVSIRAEECARGEQRGQVV